jgi:hypothetical protein
MATVALIILKGCSTHAEIQAIPTALSLLSILVFADKNWRESPFNKSNPPHTKSDATLL